MTMHLFLIDMSHAGLLTGLALTGLAFLLPRPILVRHNKDSILAMLLILSVLSYHVFYSVFNDGLAATLSLSLLLFSVYRYGRTAGEVSFAVIFMLANEGIFRLLTGGITWHTIYAMNIVNAIVAYFYFRREWFAKLRGLLQPP